MSLLANKTRLASLMQDERDGRGDGGGGHGGGCAGAQEARGVAMSFDVTQHQVKIMSATF
jgi:hypothetical protein